MSNALSFHHIAKTYRSGDLSVDVLRGVSFDLPKGKLVALVGPSGSGKSTLLQIAGLLDAASSGTVLIDDKPVPGKSERELAAIRNTRIGFIYQFHHLLPEFTALENVAMPLRIAGKTQKFAEKAAREWLDMVGLHERVSHRPSELSGGEQQRVAIARSLVNKPDILLADEPTGNLDEANSQKIFALLLKLAREQGLSAIIATHNDSLAAQMDAVWRMSAAGVEQG